MTSAKYIIGLFLTAYCSLLTVHSYSEWLPEKKQLFKPFQADQTQPSYVTRVSFPSGQGKRAEVNMGDEFGIYRGSLNGNSIQAGVMGGVAARFDISRVTNDLEIADYSLALPVDYALGGWAFRGMYWHTSSHIGDDYIRSRNVSVRKNVTDEIKFYASRDITPQLLSLRLYAGGGYAFNYLPKRSGALRAHAGAEWYHAKGWFCAVDLQSLARLKYQPSLNARFGWRKHGRTGDFSIFGEFAAGHMPYLGFMGKKRNQAHAGNDV